MKRIALAIMSGAYVLAAAQTQAQGGISIGLWLAVGVLGSASLSRLARD